MNDPIPKLAAWAGIQPGFAGIDGNWTGTQRDSLVALLRAMGLPVDGESEARDCLNEITAREKARALPGYLVFTAGETVNLPLASDVEWTLHPEEGLPQEGRGPQLPALAIGRHRLSLSGGECWLLSAPARLPAPERSWGVTLPLYGLRPAATGGLGDFGDLARALPGFADLGAGFIGINPVHAGFPTAPDFFSPYAPSSRRRLNALHCACPTDRAGQESDLVDYAGSIAARLAAFRAKFARGGASPEFERFLAQEGRALHLFATHQAISDRFGAFWNDWPREFQDPDSAEVAAFERSNVEAIRFHAFLQWQAENELRGCADMAADTRFGLYLDLAVGTHPHGAETWAAPDQFARGVSLGAPPDAFAPGGQVWGLAPFNPLTLVRDGFAPLADTLRAQLRFARFLRIDHVLGFERAFWVPEDSTAPGAYVTMPRDAMFAVVRIEAARAAATIIGEDLGNIPEGLHEALSENGILGCRVAQFERRWSGDQSFRPAHDYPAGTLASFSTHDLPTWRGWRSGRDIETRRNLGLVEPGAADEAMTERSKEVSLFDERAGTKGGSEIALNGFLARTGSRLLALQIEDMLGIEDQPNLPGTVHEYPNWRRRLPVPPEQLAKDRRVIEAAEMMARHGRRN